MRNFLACLLLLRGEKGEGEGLNITDLQLGDLGGRRLERHLSRAAAPRVGGVNVEVEATAEAVVGAQAPAKKERKSRGKVNSASQK